MAGITQVPAIFMFGHIQVSKMIKLHFKCKLLKLNLAELLLYLDRSISGSHIRDHP